MEPEIAITRSHNNVFLFVVRTTIIFILFATSATIFSFIYLLQAPKDFPIDSVITIENGSSVRTIVTRFENEGYVRSGILLQAILAFFYDATAIKAGTYTFDEPLNTKALAEYITTNTPKDRLISVTFPEGMTVADYTIIAENTLPNFAVEAFVKLASNSEGVLFPETYFVPEYFTAEELFNLFNKTYEETLSQYTEAILDHELSEYEIIILASIIEREANTPESMQYVSSVLQNRLEIGMALQADASIEYVLDTPLNELPPGALAEELRKTNSPYNTYLNTGLPPTPIGNPGKDAIEAVLFPKDTDFFYYITDNDGVFHYAKTLQEHNINIARYLR